MKGYLLIGFSAAGFGFMPIFAVYAYGDGMTVSTLLFLRFAIAAALLFAYTWWFATRRKATTRKDATQGWSRGGGRIRPPAGDLLRLLILGAVLYTAQSALYFSSVQHISPALAALLLYVYPGLVAAASTVVNKERPSPVMVLAVLISFAGVALALGRLEGDLSPVGIAEALGAAAVYTVYIVYGDRVGTAVPPVTMTAFVSLFAALSFLVYGAATQRLDLGFAAEGWLPVLAVALVSTVLAILCFFLGMALIGPTKASIGSMLEPVVSIGAAAALLGADLTWPQLLGAALVLVGATTGVLSRHHGGADGAGTGIGASATRGAVPITQRVGSAAGAEPGSRAGVRQGAVRRGAPWRRRR